MSASTSGKSGEELGYGYGEDKILVNNAGLAGGYGQGMIRPHGGEGYVNAGGKSQIQPLGLPMPVPVPQQRKRIPDDQDDWPSSSDEDEPSRSKPNPKSPNQYPKPEFHLPLPAPSHNNTRTYVTSPLPLPGASQADLLSPGLSENLGDYLKAKPGYLERNPSSATSGIGFVGDLNDGGRRGDGRPELDRRGSSAQREIGRKGIRKVSRWVWGRCTPT